MDNMSRVYKDTERGEVVTMWELLEAFEAGESEAERFGDYVWNCQRHQGGTLEELHNFAIVKGFARFRVLQYKAGNFDGIYCRDWRELKEVDTIEEAAAYIAAVM